MPRKPRDQPAKPEVAPTPPKEADADPEPEEQRRHRPSQTQHTAQQQRHTEGQVPQLERLKPQPITAEERKKLNIYEKWTRIIDEVGLVPKRGFNDHHKYWYTLEADLVAFVGPLFHKYNVMVIPAVLIDKVERIEAGRQHLTRLPMNIKVVNGDKPEDSFEVPWIGEGADTVDKGVYKAYTGGLKFFYMKLLLVATGDDPELFVRTDQIGDMAAQDNGSGRSAPTSRSVSVTPSTRRQPEKGGHQQGVTDVQIRQVRALSRGLGLGRRALAEMFDNTLGTKFLEAVEAIENEDEQGNALAGLIKGLTGQQVGQVLYHLGQATTDKATTQTQETPAEEATAPEKPEDEKPEDEKPEDEVDDGSGY